MHKFSETYAEAAHHVARVDVPFVGNVARETWNFVWPVALFLFVGAVFAGAF